MRRRDLFHSSISFDPSKSSSEKFFAISVAVVTLNVLRVNLPSISDAVVPKLATHLPYTFVYMY